MHGIIVGWGLLHRFFRPSRYAPAEVAKRAASKAAERHRKPAGQGDADAAYNLGHMYENGQGVPQDYAEAMKWYRLAADQGHPLAQVHLGYAFRFGRGVPEDETEAVKWYRLAADQGDTFGQIAMGDLYRGKVRWSWDSAERLGWPPDDPGLLEHALGDVQAGAEAEKWYRKAAEQGDDEAESRLGEMYQDGEGVLRDYGEALKWYRLSADHGNLGAQFRLGEMYEEGRGVPQGYVNDFEAVKWYRKAATRGLPHAQHKLGGMYENGRGVPSQDYVEAVKWYRLAADHCFAPAQHKLGECYSLGLGVLQDYILAHMWLNLASAQDKRASSGNAQEAAKSRDELAAEMTPAQVAEAQQLAREWVPKK